MFQITIMALAVSLSFVVLAAETEEQAERRNRSWEVDIIAETFGFDENTPSDFPWADVIQGCPARDCIPSIDAPKFVSASAADFLVDDDIVIAVTHKGESRAYPTRILVFHEIVNDIIGDQPIAVSYCPLCGSGLVFKAELDGEAVQFGVSGVLHNSDLVMYDRKSNSLWQQITGTAFAGTRRGQELATYPSAMSTWGEWRGAHPDTLVLSTDTGFSDMDYSRWPYGDYATSDKVMFPVSLSDARLHPKRVIFGVDLDGHPVAYDRDYLREKGELQDQVGGRTFNVKYHADGGVSVRESGSDQQWTAHRVFWFAWYSFHPDTLLRDGRD